METIHFDKYNQILNDEVYLYDVSKHLVVIGGGAAGFFCAINAKKINPKLKVSILEKQSKVLQKVKVSGGGRCIVTHACFQTSELVKKYPRGKNFLKKAFSIFSTQDTIQWFEEHDVSLKTESDGRMFPATDSSQTIIDCLLKQCFDLEIDLELHSEVISMKQTNDTIKLQLKNSKELVADAVFVATGGFAKMEHYIWLSDLGHRIETPIPSLFTFNIPNSNLKELMGVAVSNVQVKIAGSKLEESGSLLITHWGLSGPAVLKLSAYGAKELADKNYDFVVIVNWLTLPENKLRDKWNAIRDGQNANRIGRRNPFDLPQRLWEYFLNEVGIDEDSKWSELPSKEQNKLIHILTTHELHVKGKTTFKEEFVICGGVDLAEVNPLTMESKRVPNLYFGGEILNIDGVTGGFNFQNAWTSGYIAGKSIAEKLLQNI